MARKRRRRSRRFGDYVSVPLGLGKLKLPSVKGLNPLGKSVSSTDVLVGAFVGLGGGAAIRYAITKFWPTAPEFLRDNIAPISTISAGVAAQMLMKNKHKGTGYFVGAALAGLVPIGWGMLQAQFPDFFADYVNVDYGMLTNVGPMGLLVDEGSRSLSELAAYSMGQGEDDYSYVP